jgi:electron transfer flavoprotein beta subunit
MRLKIAVLAKQVPDTHNVGKDAMLPNGTINRAALPTVFNPEDLNALEMALSVKDRLKDVEVSVITMGPTRAADIVREALYRGADNGYVVSDRRFAGSDTLATSYALSMAVRKLGHVDLIFCGRQAIDGDTAQVGPQIAEKLDLPQITYAESIEAVAAESITVKRRLENGFETVKTALPALVTVSGSAAPCRFRHAHLTVRYKNARSTTEIRERNLEPVPENRAYLNITEWNCDDLDTDSNRLGLTGSPTRVKGIENVVLAKKESVAVPATDEGLMQLTRTLMDAHILG